MLESARVTSRMGRARGGRSPRPRPPIRLDPEREIPPMPPVSRLVRSLPFICLVVFAHACQGGDVPQAVFTASDFPALAEGIDFKSSGELSVQAWAPGNAGWKLTQDGETVTLTSSPKSGDSSPQWQKIGKVTSRSG